MIRTYVDSCVYIDAWSGAEPDRTKARSFFADPNREFISSNFVRLEPLPKPTTKGYPDELRFYERLFLLVSGWVPATDTIIDEAIAVASDCDTSGIDSIHIAATVVGMADEFVTTESDTKPMFKEKRLRVRRAQDL